MVKASLIVVAVAAALTAMLLLPLVMAYLVNVVSYTLSILNYRVSQIYLIDIDTHGNLTFVNLVLTSIVNPRKLMIIAHTTSDYLVLSSKNSILSMLLVIGGYADIIYVNGSPRIGLNKYYAKLLGIRARITEYYTCYPTTLAYIIESSTYKRLKTVELYAVIEKLSRNDDLKRH